MNNSIITDPDIDISEIINILSKYYKNLNWAEEKDGAWFGSMPYGKGVPHRFYVEIWIFREPCFITIDGGYREDVISIVRKLKLSAFDILNGSAIYYPDSLK